jgi:type I restriction enzyme S subunit
MSVRAPVGDLNIAQEKICIGRGICAMRMKNRNNLYLFYLLKHNVKNLKKTESGTVFGGVNKKDIMGLSVMWTPNLQEQKTIAATLSCLDDKIELNNRINKTLEEMAQAIFKSWFVDFEPFQNGEFIDSELGKIPKGWRVGTLDEIIELFDSKRIPLSSRKREKMQKVYPYYGATSLMDYVDDYIFDGVYVLLGEDGTVIDGKGYPILQYVWGKFWVNNHAHVLKGKNGFSEESLYILLKNTNVKSIVTGAVQLKINQSNLKSVKVIIPSVDKIAEFNYLIARFFAEKRRLSEENQILISVRDALLPKLMSGEVRVPIEEVL